MPVLSSQNVDKAWEIECDAVKDFFALRVEAHLDVKVNELVVVVDPRDADSHSADHFESGSSDV